MSYPPLSTSPGPATDDVLAHLRAGTVLAHLLRTGTLSIRRQRSAQTMATQQEVVWLKSEVERLNAEVALQKAKADAENTQLRRDLIANVSHDLRTPLVSLRGYLDLLVTKGDALPGAQRAEYLAVALRQSENLARLIDELFDLAKLDFTGTKLQREPFAMAELAADVLQKFQLHADKNNVRLELEAAAGLPFVDADLGLIERVLDNLIGNAVKHTPMGGRVCVGLHAAGGLLQVRVSDTGCGIPAAELPFVFERYYRGSSDASATSGAGLGLAITRRILELHGSRIAVASQCGEGTQFEFALPQVTTEPR